MIVSALIFAAMGTWSLAVVCAALGRKRPEKPTDKHVGDPFRRYG